MPGELQQAPAEQQADRQAADITQENLCDRTIEWRKSEHGAAQCRRDQRRDLQICAAPAEQDHRCGDGDHLGDRQPADGRLLAVMQIDGGRSAVLGNGEPQLDSPLAQTLTDGVRLDHLLEHLGRGPPASHIDGE